MSHLNTINSIDQWLKSASTIWIVTIMPKTDLVCRTFLKPITRFNTIVKMSKQYNSTRTFKECGW